MVDKLRLYIIKHGWCGIAIACGFSDTAPIKQWINREQIPARHVAMVDSLIRGEKNVAVKLVTRKKAKA